MRTKAIASGLFAFGLTTAAVDAAVIILDQGFENTTAFPTDTQLTTSTTDVIGKAGGTGGEWWASALPTTNYPAARTTTVHSGNQSLEIPRNTSSNAQVYARNDTLSADSGLIALEFYFKRGTGGGFTAKALKSGTNLTNVPTVYIIPDNRFAVYNSVDKDPVTAGSQGAGWQTLDINGTATGNGTLNATTWYGVKMVINLDAKTYNTYLDQGTGFEQVGFDTPYTDSLTGVNAVNFAPADGTAFIDDVKLTIVPEPTGAAAVGLLVGGSLLGRRRSR